MKLLQEKKLNNKGFTLIELLAVIVILAIVMGLSANSVINSINNSRKSTLYSTAQGAANSLNTWITEDSIVISDDDKTLKNKFIEDTQTTNKDNWVCIEKYNSTDYVNYQGGQGLIAALGLNENDIVFGTVAETDPEYQIPSIQDVKKKDKDNKDIIVKEYVIEEEPESGTLSTCSALRYNSKTDSYEVLLIAKRNGKFFVSRDEDHFAFSRAEGANELIND